MVDFQRPGGGPAGLGQFARLCFSDNALHFGRYFFERRFREKSAVGLRLLIAGKQFFELEELRPGTGA